MNKLLVLVHTVRPLIPEFDRLCAELLPGVQVMHILDEPLLARIRQRGSLGPEDAERLQEHAGIAGQVGAAAVLVTCSTVSPCVDGVRQGAGIPIVKIDEAMMSEAVRAGTRIGVLATARTTLEPTRQRLVARAAACGKKIELEVIYVDHALDALLRGDGPTHDSLVREAVVGLAGRVDAVVLAQASMARVKAVLADGSVGIPILSSPHLALASVRALVGTGQ